jgi:hypothetical protein
MQWTEKQVMDRWPKCPSENVEEVANLMEGVHETGISAHEMKSRYIKAEQLAGVVHTEAQRQDWAIECSKHL